MIDQLLKEWKTGWQLLDEVPGLWWCMEKGMEVHWRSYIPMKTLGNAFLQSSF